MRQSFENMNLYFHTARRVPGTTLLFPFLLFVTDNRSPLFLDLFVHEHRYGARNTKYTTDKTQTHRSHGQGGQSKASGRGIAVDGPALNRFKILAAGRVSSR